MIIEATLTCPVCAGHQQETMPEYSCQYQYTCVSCKAVIHPKLGDCCVFCSYGDYPCPPTQLAGAACCGASDGG